MIIGNGGNEGTVDERFEEHAYNLWRVPAKSENVQPGKVWSMQNRRPIKYARHLILFKTIA